MQMFKECQICSEYFLINLYRKNMAKFCSRDCKSQEMSIAWSGCNNPRSKKFIRIFKECLYCKEYYIPRKERENTSKFCSHECSIKYSKKENHGSWKGGNIQVICNFCSKKYQVPPCRVKVSHYCSRECKDKSLTLLIGENALNWKGQNAAYKKYRDRQSIQYINWRKSVFERDNYICAMCNQRGGYLEAHHIKKFSLYKEMRLMKNNGVTLCKICHQKTKGHEQDYEQIFKNIVSNRLCLV